MRSPDSILTVDGLTKRFGELVAVDDVSFSIEAGTFTGLIGPNGAGKSTVFDLITGIHDPTAGEVYFRGENITGNNLQTNAAKGLARTFQQTRVLDRMTVRENLLVASQLVDHPEARADDLLNTIGLTEKRNHLASDLSFGQQKLVSISQILMLDPDLVMLDEPLAGVSPTMGNRILETIHDLLDEGKTFLLVEHDMDVVMSECEDIIVMDSGRLLTRGSPADVKTDERVIEAYFGSGEA